MIKYTKYVLPLALVSTALAQSQGGFSPVPLWSDTLTDKSSPSDEEFVFLDLKTGEYVIQFPGSLSTDPSNDGKTIRFRVELQNLGVGSIRSSVKKEGNQFDYTYEITNGKAARRPISMVLLVGASTDDDATLSHPQWTGSRASATQPMVAPQSALADPSFLKRSALMGRYLFWATNQKGMAIDAGSFSSGFRLLSNHRPGWTTVFYAAGNGIGLPNVADSMPVKIVDKLVELQRAENYYTNGISIGPKFGPTVGVHWIAADWLFGLRIMKNRELIDPKSAYTAELLALLQRSVEGPADNIAPMTLEQAPVSSIEKEIDSAIRLALPIQ